MVLPNLLAPAPQPGPALRGYSHRSFASYLRLGLAGIPARRDTGFRICAKCVRRQKEANRYAARLAAEDDERRRSSRPPIGLRLVGGG